MAVYFPSALASPVANLSLQSFCAAARASLHETYILPSLLALDPWATAQVSSKVVIKIYFIFSFEYLILAKCLANCADNCVDHLKTINPF